MHQNALTTNVESQIFQYEHILSHHIDSREQGKSKSPGGVRVVKTWLMGDHVQLLTGL